MEIQIGQESEPLDFGQPPSASTFALSGEDWELIGAAPADAAALAVQLTRRVDALGIPATVPGDVHASLEQAGQLPELWKELNIQQASWVATKDWWYRKRFSVPDAWVGRDLWLEFDGVDYAAEFWLNGERLGRHEGAFTPVHFRVNAQALCGERNTLLVKIEHAPPEMVARLDHSRDQMGRQEVMDEVTRGVARWKCRTLTGWDWGTPLWAMGLWKDVRLRATGGVRINEASVVAATAGPAYSEADLSFVFQIDALSPGRVELCVRVRCLTDDTADGAESACVCDVALGPQSLGLQCFLASPRLWWPNGAGPQHRYEAQLVVRDHSSQTVLDTCTRRFGVRDLRFEVNAPAPEGSVYLDHFTHEKDDVWMEQGSGSETRPLPEAHESRYITVVNGKRVFACGANWLPADLLFGRVDPDRLEHLIRLSASCNINAFRVWGGGLIESEAFYELCDRYGIMVWQEMPNAGRRPLESEEALAAAETQQRGVMRRLMNHPSLIRYGFGNELYLSRDNSSQVARFEDLCGEIDPGRLCQAASPVTMDQRHGPHGFDLVDGYAVYNDGLPLSAGARFPAEWNEYGASGASSVEALRSMLPEPSLWPIREDDPAWRWHNAFDAYLGDDWLAPGNYRRFFGELPDLVSEVRASQWAQAEGLRYANQSNRRAMWQRSACFFWTLNEPWPNAAHGCIVEYAGRPKMAYYAVRKSYAPIGLGAAYPSLIVKPVEPLPHTWHVVSAEDAPVDGCVVRLSLMGLDGRALGHAERSLSVPPCQASPVDGLELSVPAEADGQVVILFAELVGPEARTLCKQTYVHRVGDHPAPGDAPLRPLFHAARAGLRCQWMPHETEQTGRIGIPTGVLSIQNISGVPALYIEIVGSSDHADLYLEDNYLMLRPGESVEVRVAFAAKPGARRQGSVRVQGWNTDPYEVS